MHQDDLEPELEMFTWWKMKIKEETKEIDLEKTERQEWKTTGEMTLVIKGIISAVAKDYM